MYSIYVHTTPDGKRYVGCTGMEPIKRFGSNGSGYRYNKNFYNDILLFGWNNINHQVLETVEDKKIAIKREEYYTLLFRSNEPEFGYNIYVGNIKDEENRKKYSEKMKGRKKSEDSKKKQSEKMKGRKQSEEIINKRLEKIKKPIIIENIKTGEILKFDSREKCAEFLGIGVGALRKFIKGVGSAFFDDYKVLK